MKGKNLRFMNLKESSMKETTKNGPFVKFCKEKGLEREMGSWEENDKKEKLENLKERLLNQKEKAGAVQKMKTEVILQFGRLADHTCH